MENRKNHYMILLKNIITKCLIMLMAVFFIGSCIFNDDDNKDVDDSECYDGFYKCEDANLSSGRTRLEHCIDGKWHLIDECSDGEICDSEGEKKCVKIN